MLRELLQNGGIERLLQRETMGVGTASTATSAGLWALSVSDWAVLLTAGVGVCSFVLNGYMAIRRDRREKEMHDQKMGQPELFDD